MDSADVSRRVKAARWLAGGTDDKGRPTPLTPEQLAQRKPLRQNGITANAVTEIERLIRTARPMELRAVATALEVSYEFLSGEPDPDADGVNERLDRMEEILERLSQWESAAVWHRVMDATNQMISAVGEQVQELSDRVAELEPVSPSRRDAAADASRLASQAAQRPDERERRIGAAPGRPGGQRESQ